MKGKAARARGAATAAWGGGVPNCRYPERHRAEGEVVGRYQRYGNL